MSLVQDGVVFFFNILCREPNGLVGFTGFCCFAKYFSPPNLSRIEMKQNFLKNN